MARSPRLGPSFGPGHLALLVGLLQVLGDGGLFFYFGSGIAVDGIVIGRSQQLLVIGNGLSGHDSRFAFGQGQRPIARGLGGGALRS